MDNWYVMSVWTGKEKALVNDVRSYNREKSIDNVSPFVPTKETFFKRSTYTKVENWVMFPGYMFVETSMDAYDFMDYFQKLRRFFHNYMAILNYGDSNDIAIKWEERLALMQLMNHEWCVKTSLGFKENNIVKIMEGALVGYEGKIKKIDRNKMKAWVEIEILGKLFIVEVGLQVIK